MGRRYAKSQEKIWHGATGHNVSSGSSALECPYHSDISHAFGAICKRRYESKEDFAAYVELLGKKRLEMHLTDKAFLLPPNQRSTCRFMNISPCVEWCHRMLGAIDALSPELKEKILLHPSIQAADRKAKGCGGLPEGTRALVQLPRLIKKRCSKMHWPRQGTAS